MKKSELIKIAIKENIFFCSSWNKAKIQENIDKDIKKDSKLTVVCSRSGLEFEVLIGKVREGLVHPEIAKWLNCKDLSVRYPAITAIEEGKDKGLKTYQQFEEIIEATIEEENKPESIPDHDFVGSWLAKIEGAHEKYRFKRSFSNPVYIEGRYKYFKIKNQSDGIYETGYKSNAGNNTKNYYQIVKGEVVKIELEQVEQEFPEVSKPEVSKEDYKDCLVVKENLGITGNVVSYKDNYYKIVKLEVEHFYEDDDGATHTSYPSDANYVFQISYYKTFLESATELDIAEYNQSVKEKQKAVETKKQLRQINEDLLNNPNRISPINCGYPKGIELVLRQGYYQPNEILIITQDSIWSLVYNGRDGDDWSYNNVSGMWVGCYLPINSGFREKVISLIEDVKNYQQTVRQE